MISLSGVSHAYRMGRGAVRALDRVELSIPSSSITALLGPSGSGKSTLLHLIGGIERCQAGQIVVDEWPVSTLGAADLARYRRTYVGFVFQAFHLLPTLTAAENVEMPLVLAGQSPAERRHRALAVLERVGLAERATHRPDQLSGGEQQRVAVARALIHSPRLLVADEPTRQPRQRDRRAHRRATLGEPARRRVHHRHRHPQRSPGRPGPSTHRPARRPPRGGPRPAARGRRRRRAANPAGRERAK